MKKTLISVLTGVLAFALVLTGCDPAPVGVTGVTLNQESLSMTAGETAQLTATISPDNAAVQTVSWTSSDTAVATVNESGLVTAVAAGSATITVTSTDGGFVDTCPVTVVAPTVPVTGVSIDADTGSITVGQTFTIVATVAPETASNKTVAWASDNTGVATVADGVVTGVAPGTANITVTTADGSFAKTCVVTVNAVVVPVSGVTLNDTTKALAVGGTYTLVATVAPADATNKNVVWSSSNEAVATVSSAGLVTAVANGTANITVTSAADSSKSASCAVTVTTPLTGIALSDTAKSLVINTTYTLVPVFTPATASNKAVTWSSSDSQVAQVSDAGVVTAIGLGTASITVTAADGNKTAVCAITVVNQTIPATAITLAPNSAAIQVGGDALTLVATITPANSTDSIAWSTSSDTVATVSSGVVSAVGNGTATITATIGTLTATCDVTVTTPAATISVTETASIAAEGGTAQLTATVGPDTASDKTVTWSTSDATIATVSNTGLVTAVNSGTVTITASATGLNGAISDTCTVTITIPVASVSVSPATLALTGVDSTGTVAATVLPATAANKTVTYSSSDANVATVNASTGLVTAKASGTATITATTADGAKTATCAVTVTIPVTSINVTPATATLTVGGTTTLTAEVLPATATTKTYAWSTSDANVASVSAAGVVTAVAAGSATITATTTDGSKKDTCVVTVNSPADVTLYTNSGNLVYTLPKNSTYNYQEVYGLIPDGTQLAVGDVLYVTLEGSCNKVIEGNGLRIFFVDNTEASGWWSTLSAEQTIVTNLPSGKTFRTTVTVPITTAAGAATAAANKIGINIAPTSADSSVPVLGHEPTLTLTGLSIVHKKASPSSTNYTVTYNQDYAGSTSPTVQVVSGGTVASLALSRTAYTMDGWFTTSGGSTAVDFNTAISADTEIFAKWTAVPTYTISFDSQGGSAVSDVVVSQGDTLSAPTAPTKDGYTFVGWYTESACTNAYDFNTTITANDQLFAKWLAWITVDLSGTANDYGVSVTKNLSWVNFENPSGYQQGVIKFAAADLSAYNQIVVNAAADAQFALKIGSITNNWDSIAETLGYPTGTGTATDFTYDISAISRTSMNVVGICGNNVAANVKVYSILFRDTTNTVVDKVINIGTAANGYGMTLTTSAVSSVLLNTGTQNWWQASTSFTSVDLSLYSQVVFNVTATSGAQIGFTVTAGGTDANLGYPNGTGAAADFTYSLPAARTAVTKFSFKSALAATEITVNSITIK